MNKVDRRMKRLQRQIEALESQSINSIGRIFQQDYRKLKRELDKIYKELEVEGQIDMYQYVSYKEHIFRLKVAEQVIETYKKIQDKTEEVLKQSATRTREELATMTKIPAIKKEYDVGRVINSNMKGIRWQDIHQKNRDKVIGVIAEEVKEGMEKGRTYHQVSETLAERLGKELRVVERVVRTESNRVVNMTKMDSFREINEEIPLKKKWISSRDERVRDSHSILDGTIIDIDEEFEVNGYSAEAPGMFGVPEEDISCRCIVVPVIDI